MVAINETANALALALCYWIVHWIICYFGRWRTSHPSPHVGDREPRADIAIAIYIVGPWVVAIALHLLLQIESKKGWFFVAMFMCVCAFAINTFASHSRSLKYLLFNSGGACLAVGLVMKDWDFASDETALISPLGLVVGLFSLAVPLAMLRPSSGFEHVRSRLRAARWHRVVSWWQGADPASVLSFLAISIGGGGAFLLACRYFIGIRLAGSPVVYLRSFGAQYTSYVFSRIVAPAVFRFLPLTGWVHRRQDAIALQSMVPKLWWSKFHAIPDHAWQRHVEHGLKKAGAAIIDVSDAGSATLWELSKAVECIPHERICVLSSVPIDLSPLIRSSVEYIQYGFDEASVRAARQRLADWTARVAFQLHGVEPPKFIKVSSARSEIHPLYWVAMTLVGLIVFQVFASC